jgi:MIP family channel proteins
MSNNVASRQKAGVANSAIDNTSGQVGSNQASNESTVKYVIHPIGELIGTFLFVLIGAGSIVSNSFTNSGLGLVGIALAHGFALAIVVSIFGGLSGGHINPAVTIAMMVTRRIEFLRGILYIIAQLIGATIAGLVLKAVFPAAAVEAAHLGTPALGMGVSVGTGILLEAVMTFFLLMAVFGTAVDPRAPKIGGFGIGLTVMVDILLGGALTGAAMNPAIAFGPALADSFWTNQYIYWVGPIIGAVIAALIYEFVILRPTLAKNA